MKLFAILVTLSSLQAYASNSTGENCVANIGLIDQAFQQVTKTLQVEALAQVSRGVVKSVVLSPTSCKVYVEGAQVLNAPGIMGRLCAEEIGEGDLLQSGVNTALNLQGECRYEKGQAFSGIVYTKDGQHFLE